MTSPRGTYLIISDMLRAKIKERAITEKLPSEAQLMRDHGVSRTTVRRALGVLQAEGLIESAAGIGWRVGQASDRRPLTERMTDLIREKTVGDAFPSEAKLCEEYGVSRTAVRRALAQLEGSGLLDAVHGKGRVIRALPTSMTTS